MSKYTSHLTKVNPEKISLESLKEAAEYFSEKLRPLIPKSLIKKEHMKDHLKISVEDEKVVVYFEETSFYWRFAENGTVKMKAQHFVAGTWEQEKTNIEDIMTRKLLKELEGN